MTEKELIQGLAAGEYRAYEQLFRLHYTRFVRFATTLTGDETASKDLVQEAFVKVWLNRGKLDADKSLTNYLYVLVKRAALNFLRDRKFAESLAEYPSQISSDGLLFNDDVNRILRQRVETMPEKRREVFLMSREQGLSNNEIAATLHISPKTVERHITLALADLRKNLS